MSHTPHELHEDFPEFSAKISALKQSDAHFSRLAQEYHEINRAVHRAEARIDPMDDLAFDDLRKKRMLLKDQIYRMLAA